MNVYILKFSINKILIVFLLLTILLLSLNVVNAYSNDDVNFSDYDTSSNLNNGNLSVGVYDAGVGGNLNNGNLSVGVYDAGVGGNLSGDDLGNNIVLNPNLVDENSSFGNNSLDVNNSDFESTVFNYNGQVFNVSNIGDGHFVISQDNNNVTVYKFNVNSEEDLKNISFILKNLNVMDNIILINFIKNINVTQFDTNVLFSSSRILSINGNGVKVSANRPGLHFLTSGLLSDVFIYNLTLEGFDSSIINYGRVTLEDVNFVNNINEPICNYGNLECTNCSFLNNTGNSSAGIYVANSAYAAITNCVFKNNTLIKNISKDTNLTLVNKYLDIIVEGGVVYIFNLDGFNEKPVYRSYDNGKVIFKNTTNFSYNLTIDRNHSVESIANKVGHYNGKSEIITININTSPYSKYDVTLNKSNYLFHPRCNLLVINGNGATINLKNHNDKNEDHFLICDENVTVIINNLTITGFNTAIYNYGNMVLNNVTFKNNRLNYVADFDVGGAIINNGFLTCINCSFINNYACFGGAIFSNGSSSKLNLTNCFFKDNVAYRKDGDNLFWRCVVPVNNYINNKHDTIYKKGGNDVFVGGNSIVFVYHLDNSSTSNSRIDFGWDDIGHTIVLRNSFDPIVMDFVINDSDSFQKVTSAIWNANTKVDVFIVNITGKLSINPWSNNLFYLRYGNLIINSDGGSINVINPKLRSDFHFAFVNQFSTLTVNNLTLSGFNCAIYNYGVLNLNNVIFSNNRLQYVLEDCDAGAIYNLGLLNCYNCTFVNNSAKWGGAVYNAHGAQSYFTLCDFINNTNDNKDGANIYNFNHANSFFVSENSNQNGRLVNYGSLPSGKFYEFKKAMTYVIAFSIGAVVTGLCPAGGGVVGVLVGTFVGTGLDVVNDMVYARDTHHFSYSIFTNIPLSAWNHFLFASVGASIGYSIRQEYSPYLGKDSHKIQGDRKSPISESSFSESSFSESFFSESKNDGRLEISNEIFEDDVILENRNEISNRVENPDEIPNEFSNELSKGLETRNRIHNELLNSIGDDYLEYGGTEY